MNKIIWPTDKFGCPLIKSYSLKYEESVARTKMESGSAKQRLRFTTIPTNVKITLVMNEETYENFRAWFVRKINYGADYFIMPIKSGIGMKDETVRFIKPYSSTTISHDTFKITGELEVQKLNVLSLKDLDDFLGPETIVERLANRLHKYIHIDKGSIYKW